MRKKWFSVRELTEMAGLPKSPQGINKRAKREGWICRVKEGVQGGKAKEYFISSLPAETQASLEMKEATAVYGVSDHRDAEIWMRYFYQLTPNNRQRMLSLFMDKGIEGILALLSEERSPHR